VGRLAAPSGPREGDLLDGARGATPEPAQQPVDRAAPDQFRCAARSRRSTRRDPGASIPRRRPPRALATACGALLFFASDTVLALDGFVAPVPLAPFWILSTSFTAQLLIARHALPDPPARRAAPLPVHVAG